MWISKPFKNRYLFLKFFWYLFLDSDLAWDHGIAEELMRIIEGRFIVLRRWGNRDRLMCDYPTQSRLCYAADGLISIFFSWLPNGNEKLTLLVSTRSIRALRYFYNFRIEKSGFQACRVLEEFLYGIKLKLKSWIRQPLKWIHDKKELWDKKNWKLDWHIREWGS